MSALIEFEEVCKYYQMGDTTVKAADHITMKIDKGEFVAIVGQSGSGKSTCMNIIGCLDVPTHGVYRLNGRDVGKMSRNELASVRNEMLGFIFQQYNLLPRLNLMENVEVPLVYAGVSRAERHARAREVLEQVGLGDKLKNRPNQLSGGQQQRVALARAIVTRPKVLLLDEPLSAIDAKLRKSLQVEIRRIQKQLNITTIFVTHDQDEAMVMSDRICLLNCGKIEQMDTPIAIYTHPRTKFAAGFIGSYNVLEPLEFGRVTGDIDLPAQPIAIRPEVLNIAREKQNLPGTYDIEGTVIDSTPRGNVLRYKVDVNGVQLSADTLFRSFSIYENGSKVWLSLEKRNCLHVEEEAV